MQQVYYTFDITMKVFEKWRDALIFLINVSAGMNNDGTHDALRLSNTLIQSLLPAKCS